MENLEKLKKQGGFASQSEVMEMLMESQGLKKSDFEATTRTTRTTPLRSTSLTKRSKAKSQKLPAITPQQPVSKATADSQAVYAPMDR